MKNIKVWLVVAAVIVLIYFGVKGQNGDKENTPTTNASTHAATKPTGEPFAPFTMTVTRSCAKHTTTFTVTVYNQTGKALTLVVKRDGTQYGKTHTLAANTSGSYSVLAENGRASTTIAVVNNHYPGTTTESNC